MCIYLYEITFLGSISSRWFCTNCTLALKSEALNSYGIFHPSGPNLRLSWNDITSICQDCKTQVPSNKLRRREHIEFIIFSSKPNFWWSYSWETGILAKSIKVVCLNCLEASQLGQLSHRDRRFHYHYCHQYIMRYNVNEFSLLVTPNLVAECLTPTCTVVCKKDTAYNMGFHWGMVLISR